MQEKDVDIDDMDRSISIRSVKGSEIGRKTTIEFIKVINAGHKRLNIDKPIDLIYAIGNEDRLVEHPKHGKGYIRLNLKSGEHRRVKESREIFYYVHGSLMVISLLGFLPLGKDISFSSSLLNKLYTDDRDRKNEGLKFLISIR